MFVLFLLGGAIAVVALIYLGLLLLGFALQISDRKNEDHRCSNCGERLKHIETSRYYDSNIGSIYTERKRVCSECGKTSTKKSKISDRKAVKLFCNDNMAITKVYCPEHTPEYSDEGAPGVITSTETVRRKSWKKYREADSRGDIKRLSGRNRVEWTKQNKKCMICKFDIECR